MRILLKWVVSILITSLMVGCGDGFKSLNGPGDRFSSSSECCAGGSLPSASPRTALLDNPGFEADLRGWDDWGNSAITMSDAHSGTRALRITTGQGGRGQEVIYRLKTGAKYKLSGFAKVDDTGDSVYLGMRFSDNTNATIADQKIRVATTDYAGYSIEFVVPVSVSSAQVYVYKENTSTTGAVFDDIALEMTGAPVNPPMQAAVSNPSNLQPQGLASGWTLVLNEDFTNASLNVDLWNSGLWFNYTINSELQAYRPENVQMTAQGVSLLAEDRATVTTWGDAMNYASGAITTRHNFTFTFGAVEARIRIPKGQGFYPQFWLLPNDKSAPPEIDVLQVNGADPSLLRFAYDWMDDSGIARGQPMTANLADLSAGYHTYTLEWLPDHIAYFIDGVQIGRYTGDFVLRDPAYLIFNLAIGGNTVGSPSPATVFPQSMDIDYVRVWQRP